MNMQNFQFAEVNVSHCWLMDPMGLSLVLSSSLFPLLMIYFQKLIKCKFLLKWQSHIQDFLGRSVFENFHKLHNTRVDANYDFWLVEISRSNITIY